MVDFTKVLREGDSITHDEAKYINSFSSLISNTIAPDGGKVVVNHDKIYRDTSKFEIGYKWRNSHRLRRFSQIALSVAISVIYG